MTFYSFSQNFEDVILWRVLREVKNGFYIDAGAFDPDIHSVTRTFYESGWSGINIEPSKFHFQKFLKVRDRDINLNLAVASENGVLPFFEMREGGLSTVNENVAAKHRMQGFQFEESQVQSRRLSDIIDEYVPGRIIHFLKIDVEGFEKMVIEGIDLGKHRPWIIVVESFIPLTQQPNHAEWEQILLNNSYHHVYSDGLNRFYLALELAHLTSRFNYPPNVFDDFIPVSLSQYSAILGDREVVRALQQKIHFLENKLQTVHSSKSWKLARLISFIFRIFFVNKLRIRRTLKEIMYLHGYSKKRKFNLLRLENLVPTSLYQLEYSERPVSRDDWKSEVISEKRFKEENFFIWMSFLKERPRLHSKLFQFYAIMEAANSLLMEGNEKGVLPKAIGFGVGTEPIPAALGKIGFKVTATDFLDGDIASTWQDSNQLIHSVKDLNSRGILTENEFEAVINFLNLDMNKIPIEFQNKYDFVWSSCALGHIGGYQQGLDFIFKSSFLLKPGGIALHTTELDLSDNPSRYESSTLNFYKPKDLIEVLAALRSHGFQVDDFYVPKMWTDRSVKYLDREPWGDQPHIRIELYGREVVSVVMKITRC